MASPIFGSLFIKKYMVQLRVTRSGRWQDRAGCRRLDEAERKLQKLLRQNPGANGRIINRLTGQTIREYPAQP